MAEIETVKIIKNNTRGFCIINKSDFNPLTHKLYGVVEQPEGPTVAEMKDKLKELNVKIPQNATKAQLSELLEKAGSK